MAKKNAVAVAATPKVNKAKAIREYKVKNPEAKPAEIVAALAEQGVEISANYIATVNYHKNGSKKKGVADFKEVYARLRAATKACKSVGGIPAAQKSLAQVKQLGVELETTNIDDLLEMVNSLADAVSDDTEVAPAPPTE